MFAEYAITCSTELAGANSACTNFTKRTLIEKTRKQLANTDLNFMTTSLRTTNLTTPKVLIYLLKIMACNCYAGFRFVLIIFYVNNLRTLIICFVHWIQKNSS